MFGVENPTSLSVFRHWWMQVGSTLTIVGQRHLLSVSTTGSGGHPTGVSTSGTTVGRLWEPSKELKKPEENRTGSWRGTRRNDCGGTTAPELNLEPVELNTSMQRMTPATVAEEAVR